MDGKLLKQLTAKLPGLVTDEPLSRHSTIRVGGPAAALVTTKTVVELVEAVKTAREFHIPFHILGGGSNTLFSDQGFDGLIIKNIANQLTVGDQVETVEEADWQQPSLEARHEAADPLKYVSFLDLNYEERPGDTLVVAESGINLTGLIVKTLDAGLTGLQWFGGIPGVVGGAVYNNIHGGSHLIGDRVQSATALLPNNSTRTLTKDELEFGYDHSRFHSSGEIILAVTFLLTKATSPEREKAEYTFREWVKRKTLMQPHLGSLGSMFQNISQATREKIGAPTTAAGWLIDQVGLKGHRIGQAQIAPEHANFVVNHGGATAHEVYQLLTLAKQKVKQKFGVELNEEVFLIGEF